MSTIPEDPNTWRRCNSCKKPIPFKALYWVCNVSTCNRKRTGLTFCTVSCWDAHLPGMNHRESWAEERKTPSREEWAQMLIAEDAPRTRKKAEPVAAPTVTPPPTSPARTILRRSKSED